MTTTEREELREKVLQICHAANVLGVPEDRLLRSCVRYGLAVTAEDLSRELRHLESLAFIKPVEKDLSPVNRRWATTHLGDNYLEAQGLI